MGESFIGLLGGTFDPVHAGHLAVARLALEALGMSEVRFIPAASPPHKSGRRLSDRHHRYAMLALATIEDPRLRVSLDELGRPGRSYTIDTLRRLRLQPGERRRCCFLIGADAFAEIETWRRARSVLEEIEFVVFPRAGIHLPPLGRRLPDWATRHLVEYRAARGPLLPTSPPRVHWVPLRTPDVSSTEVRRRAAAGEEITGLVPPLVAHYIAQYGLYRAGAAARGTRARGPGRSRRAAPARRGAAS